MRNVKIGNRVIGEGHSCFIVAEAGANHNRNLDIAKKLIAAASEAGADAIKFQVYSAETLYSKNVPQHSNYKKRLWDLIKEIEMPRDWLSVLKEECDRKQILFFATPFDFQAVDELASTGVPCYKVASFEIVDLELVEYIARKAKPVIISTGMATMEEIGEAYDVCRRVGNDDACCLPCASLYPAKAEIMNLRSMKTIRDALGVPVGLSDHSERLHIPIAAVAMGAEIIEKHFTLSRKMEGPDHPFALEAHELKEMVDKIRDVEKAFGDGKKLGPSQSESENFQIARRSIHANAAIPKGATITRDMLIVKRPGLGIKPKFMQSVVGRIALRNIKKDEWITEEMLSR